MEPRALVLCATLAALWALVALVTPAAAASREQIKPSLECSCRTSQRQQDRFDLSCQSADYAKPISDGGIAHALRMGQSNLSCIPGPAPDGSAGGDWWQAELPARGAYRLSRRALTWQDAEAACEAQRDQLVALDGGEAELKEVLRAFAHAADDPKELLWAGIRYWPREKAFYTVRGQEMARLPWRPGHPDPKENKTCVTIGIEGKLHGPHGCNGKRRFFCKR